MALSYNVGIPFLTLPWEDITFNWRGAVQVAAAVILAKKGNSQFEALCELVFVKDDLSWPKKSNNWYRSMVLDTESFSGPEA